MLGSARVFIVRVALCVALLAVTISATPALGADPTPGPSPVLVDPLDPRAGAGANRVGAPLVALLAVVGVGLAAAAGTALFVLVTRTR